MSDYSKLTKKELLYTLLARDVMLKDCRERFELHKNTDAKTIQDQSDLIEELKAKLAEKDEIIDWQNDIVEGVKQEEELLAQKLKSLGVDCIENLGKYHNQDKISFAVEQLEKMKETLIQNADEIGEEYKEDYFMISLGTIKNIIDNQIKQLKECE